MYLVDTSVWIDHFRQNSPELSALLNDRQILSHPFVIGELALGNIRRPDEIIGLLNKLPQAPVATPDEVLRFIRSNFLAGQGIGYVDAHLLASTRLSPGLKLWTRDKRLLAASLRLGLSANFTH